MGFSADVPHTDPNAAKFSVSPSAGNRNILVQFTLPVSLTFSQYSIPINFDYSHSAYSLDDLPYGRINFNPAASLRIDKIHHSQQVYIWLGGFINIPLDIFPGIYQGTIILTAEII